MEEVEYRDRCYKCYRPQSSCMCKHINPIHTETKFVILMHPKEYKKTKNGTGHFTNLSLPNSEIHIGINFTNNNRINELINNSANECYIIYPGKESINLNEKKITTQKNIVLFLIDSTWACSKKMIRESHNLIQLPKVSFTHTKKSMFRIKEQPADYCLSTMESTLCILELLNMHNIENIKESSFKSFLQPFHQMIEYQINRAAEHDIRYK